MTFFAHPSLPKHTLQVTHAPKKKHTKIPHRANGMLVIRTSSVRCPAVCVNNMPTTFPSTSHFESENREKKKKMPVDIYDDGSLFCPM